jgi:hypothetical protein
MYCTYRYYQIYRPVFIFLTSPPPESKKIAAEACGVDFRKERD